MKPFVAMLLLGCLLCEAAEAQTPQFVPPSITTVGNPTATHPTPQRFPLQPLPPRVTPIQMVYVSTRGEGFTNSPWNGLIPLSSIVGGSVLPGTGLFRLDANKQLHQVGVVPVQRVVARPAAAPVGTPGGQMAPNLGAVPRSVPQFLDANGVAYTYTAAGIVAISSIGPNGAIRSGTPIYQFNAMPNTGDTFRQIGVAP